jgi:hypothetical protein
VTVDDLLTAAQAATYLAVSRRTLDRLGLPRIIFSPRLVRYERSALDAYRARCSTGGSKEPTTPIKSRIVKPKADAEFEKWLAGAKGKGA